MKVLYYCSCSFDTPHFAVIANQVLHDIKEGNDVYFSYCKRAISKCPSNPEGKKLQCAFCQYTYSKVLKIFKGKAKVIPLYRQKVPVYYKCEFDTFNDIKKLEYKNAKVGYSILSFIISMSRNMDFPISAKLHRYVEGLYQEICGEIDEAYKLIDVVKPDYIKIYNGRLFSNRFFYDIASNLNIDFSSLEVIGGLNEPFYPVEFKGGLPHNISVFTQQVKDVWNQSVESEESKKEIGASFYEKRRKGIVACDKVYTGDQHIGELPENFDFTKTNIVIFNSSADEVASLGGEWEESTRLFSSQYEAIEFMLQNAPKSYQFYLRIHPNLASVKYPYHTDLYRLADKYPNITVIPPKSSISSYSLLDVASKIIVFGSTIGIEACYWRKPTILIGTAFYANLGVCNKAESKQDLISKLTSENLPLGSKLAAINYAYFLMDRKYRITTYNNIKINNESFHFLGKEIPMFDFCDIMGFRKLYGILWYLSYWIRCDSGNKLNVTLG